MPVRATTFQKVQLGVEDPVGTLVAATKQLQTLSFEPKPMTNTAEFRPIGSKFNTIVYPTKEWMQYKITGIPAYSELQYIFAAAVSLPTTTTVAGSAVGHSWTFEAVHDEADTVAGYTIEQGTADTRAHLSTYNTVDNFDLKWDRDKLTVDAQMTGRGMVDGITPTDTGVTANAVQPILPSQVSIYIDPTSAALGTTKLTNVYEGNFKTADRFNPEWPLDAALPSFNRQVEKGFDFSFEMTAEADATNMARLDEYRSGTTSFMRIGAVGAAFSDAGTHLMHVDFAGVPKITDIGDKDGVYCVKIQMLGVYNSVWGKAFSILLQNLYSDL